MVMLPSPINLLGKCCSIIPTYGIKSNVKREHVSEWNGRMWRYTRKMTLFTFAGCTPHIGLSYISTAQIVGQAPLGRGRGEVPGGVGAGGGW